MKPSKELSIVIPCKNEEKYIPLLLDSLIKQTYSIKNIPIYIADANSTDNTRKIINGYKNKYKLKIKIIPGGFPPYGRNSGAKKCKSKYILFIDADVILSRRTIEKSISLIKRKNLHCVASNILCDSWDPFANLLYIIFNIIMHLSKYDKPLSPGAFMLFERKKFNQLGGFNEKIHFAEDYFLTKQLERKKFGVASTYFLTSNRRFKQTGYFGIMKLYMASIIYKNNDSYFFKDKKYWKSS